MVLVSERQQALAVVEGELRRRKNQSLIEEESITLMQDFKKFVLAAWMHLEPWSVFRSNWHIDAICEHLQAVSESKLFKLQIWVPPVSMKSRLVSVLWPAWEWTHSPALRYWTASYDISLSKEMTMYSRDLMLDDWYQARWGDKFQFRKTDEAYLINDQAGSRLSTSPSSKGTGKHGHRVMFDDPLNAGDADRISKATLQSTNEWYTGTTATRGLEGAARIIVMQRLHENDMAAHALQFGDWEVLCLPERYWKHPYAWKGDPRKEGDLLWPQKRPEATVAEIEKALGVRHSQGQLQQWPTAREGNIIPRADWRYYPVAHLDLAEGEKDVSKLPPFRSIVCSWDTSMKDLNDSDYVAGGCWGVHGGNRFLLKTFHQRASLSATKTAMLNMRQWALERWPKVPIRVLIEKQSNGTTIIDQLKSTVPGVIPILTDTDKTLRAEASEPDFNGHSVFVPGAATEDFSDYDPAQTPGWVQDLIEECCNFPLGKNDDLVDMTTMALNWIRTRPRTGSRSVSATKPASTSEILRERSRVRTAQRSRRAGVGVYRLR